MEKHMNSVLGVDTGRKGTSGSLGSGRSAGYAIGEGRTSPWLRAIAGIRGVRIPGLAQARAGSPEPLRGKLCEPTLCLCTTSRSRRRPAVSVRARVA